MGGRIFANQCPACHGSDARGNRGYPDLSDDDWIHGGLPENVVQTITHGRNGVMPALAVVIGGDAGVADVTSYMFSLSGREHDAASAARGAVHFQTICSACHQANGRGNPMIGAPDLTDDVWLHGGRSEDVKRILDQGVASQMPAHESILSPEQIHLVAAYVLSLSANADAAEAQGDDEEVVEEEEERLVEPEDEPAEDAEPE